MTKNIIIGLLSIVSVVSMCYGYRQRQRAVDTELRAHENERLANELRARAEEQTRLAEQQRAIAASAFMEAHRQREIVAEERNKERNGK